MKSLDQFVQEQIARDPSFAEELEFARAELNLGLLINRLRESRGWTQRELAERAGMPQPAVARYEKAGRTPSITVLWRFARALGVSLVLGPDLSVEAVECETDPQVPDGASKQRAKVRGGLKSSSRDHAAEAGEG